MTLTEFLLARIAEDESAARVATDGPWWYDPKKWNSIDHEESVFAGERGSSATTIASTGPGDDQQSMLDAVHIARHDPDRVLAECEAKRAIVDHYAPYAGGSGRLTLQFIALPYADHDDYREEWRP